MSKREWEKYEEFHQEIEMWRRRAEAAEKLASPNKDVEITAAQYEDMVRGTAIYPGRLQNNFVYPTLGLVGEAGEVAEKVKKLIRDKNNELTPEYRDEIIKELSDVQWYVAALAHELGTTLGHVMKVNHDKLLCRMARGKLQGSGDNR